MSDSKEQFDAAMADLNAAIDGVAAKDTAQEGEAEALQARIADLEAQIAAGGATAAEEADMRAAVVAATERLKALGISTTPTPTPSEPPAETPAEPTPTDSTNG